MPASTPTRRTRRTGTTWLQPAGVTWVVVITAVLSLLATTTPTSTDADTTASAAVGLLEPSWVEMLGTDARSNPVSLDDVRRANLPGGAPGDGSGIDVALIDTGVAPVKGLDNVIHGPDLSAEGAHADTAYLDTYGHGTHMAGIIAGNRSGAEGLAPGARIVSVKVAGHDGITSVPQVVAAIDWVVEHGQRDGLNIRVLNLSLGQKDVKHHVGDELSAAVERAWHAGILVVVAAGNDGDVYQRLDSPAIDPFVVAVGAMDTNSSHVRGHMDVAPWTATGDGIRNPDVVAPGVSVTSYRVPGSTADQLFPNARIGADLFLGSGSSQAAASVSGSAAAILSAYPSLTNDELKHSLTMTASELRKQPVRQAGDGLINGDRAGGKAIRGIVQRHRLASDGSTGIVTPKGATWSGGTWSATTWSGGTWSATTWSGGTWSGATWSGATWSSATWSGATWSGGTWSGATWSGSTWSGSTWSGGTWSGNGWS